MTTVLNRFLFCVVLISTLCCPGSSSNNVFGRRCIPLKKSIHIPINVRLLFVGAPPLFMRDDAWISMKQNFLQDISTTVQYPATLLGEDVLSEFPLFGRPHPSSCSAVTYHYSYDIVIADSPALNALDQIVSTEAKEAQSSFLDASYIADQFWAALYARQLVNPTPNATQYDFVIYNAMSVAPQYGFRAEIGAAVGTMGIATAKRFAFLDVGARPFFLSDAKGMQPGEVLMSVSGNPTGYAHKLHSIVSSLLTPPLSSNMHQFPHETRLAFNLRPIDVSAIIGRMKGTGGDSTGTRSISHINTSQFIKFLHSAIPTSGPDTKMLAFTLPSANVTDEAWSVMAVTRAFSLRGLEFILDSEQLLKDIVNRQAERAGYFVDLSYVAHIPIYVLSFADDTRTVHVDGGEDIRSAVIGRKAIVLVENRLRDSKSDVLSLTSEASKKVLELLCGLRSETLNLVNASAESLPLITRDQVLRNVLTQRLDWSQAAAGWAAEEALNFEGLDSRLIPHEKGSAIEAGRHLVHTKLHDLYLSWEKAGVSLRSNQVQAATLRLIRASKDLANKLHEEVCNQPLPDEILLKAEAEVASENLNGEFAEPSLRRWLGIPSLLGFVVGVIAQLVTIYRRREEISLRSGTLPGAVDLSASRSTWFSTMSSDKSKLQ